jgi:predicted nuclease of predicted toxin-antitoxin system
MRFKTDENVHPEAAALLRTAGHEAITVRDQGLRGCADPTVADVCRREGRVLVTLDKGFGDIRLYPPEIHPGLIVLRLERQDRKSVVRALERLLPLLITEPLVGRLWVVDESSLRVRGEGAA